MRSIKLADWGWYILIACVGVTLWVTSISIWLSIGLARIG